MANFNKGFHPVGNMSDTGIVGKIRNFRARTTLTGGKTGIYKGDVLVINPPGDNAADPSDPSDTDVTADVTGRVEPAANAAIANIVGVAVGAFYIGADGKPVEAEYVLSGTTSAAGEYNGVKFNAGDAPMIKVIADPNMLYVATLSQAHNQNIQGMYFRLFDHGTTSAAPYSDGVAAVHSVTEATQAAGRVVDTWVGTGAPVFGDSETATEYQWGTADTAADKTDLVIVKLNTIWGA